MNARYGSGAERQRRTERWLDALLPGDRVIGLPPVVSDGRADPASLAVEGLDAERARIKLYFRLLRRARLSELGIPPAGAAGIEHFLSTVLEEHTLAIGGLVVSLGFGAVDGSWADFKLDICAHCLNRAGPNWAACLTGLTRTFGLVEPRCLPSIAGGSCEVALVGFGANRENHPRLNIYMKEPAIA
jgi:hypothetical protein